jgi:hypothetical protein
MTSTLFLEVPFNRLGRRRGTEPDKSCPAKPGRIKRVTCRIAQGFQINEGENSMIPAVKAQG